MAGTLSPAVKAELRRRMRSTRAALSPEARLRESRAVMDRLLTLPALRSPRLIGAYWALPEEVDLGPLLRTWAGEGRRVALPRVQGSDLVFHAWSPVDELRLGPHRVQEPAASLPTVTATELEALLVPGLAFDRRGHRLGFGHGYFDRFLARAPRAVRIGVGFDLQLVDRLAEEAHDAPMDWVVLPSQVIRCRTSPNG